jgi:hypothetical protein
MKMNAYIHPHVTMKTCVRGNWIGMQLDCHKNYYAIRVQLQYENTMN